MFQGRRAPFGWRGGPAIRAAGLLCCLMVCTAQAPVQTPSAPGVVAPSPDGAAELPARVGRDRAARTEAHIARLRAALRITPAQEPLWRPVAAALRQNVVDTEAAYATRRAHGDESLDAVQSLRTYQGREAANLANVQRLLPPFEALYQDLSPSQRREADRTLQHYLDRQVRRPD